MIYHQGEDTEEKPGVGIGELEGADDDDYDDGCTVLSQATVFWAIAELSNRPEELETGPNRGSNPCNMAQGSLQGRKAVVESSPATVPPLRWVLLEDMGRGDGAVGIDNAAGVVLEEGMETALAASAWWKNAGNVEVLNDHVETDIYLQAVKSPP